ncbi:MAG: ABC transporter ATP-binding protein [Alistipes senegalensis]|nr:ABC transporter ATP-binding protein [Alistipes senegalensis]
MNVLNTEKLSVGYGKKIVAGNITFEIRHGEILTLIGANGSGKSTILKSILMQIKKLSGNVYIENKDIDKMKLPELAKKISAVMTERISPELMTCGDVVESGRYPYTNNLGILSAEDREKVREAMALVGVEDLAFTAFSQVSDGQRQRIMLARAICQDTEILILDEPTSFLDVRHKIELLNILQKLVREKNLSVIMSLHELDLAQKISDKIICINNHTAERAGTPEEIFSGGYIAEIYGMNNKSFDYIFCSSELEKPSGEPEVFVISGGGAEIYRKLQRKNIPFAAGVIHENIAEYPVLKALAAEIVTEKPFEPISDKSIEKALKIMKKCRSVINNCQSFGAMNQKNAVLLETAEKLNIPVQNI